MLLPTPLILQGEALRPQFHFTAPSGWINDPNGLVFENGTYHLFYQHNPFGTQWGNMTWGHATSRDLIHWQHLPSALTPDSLGTMFSGSAVIDHANTSGFGSAEKPPLVCIYTAAGGTNDASKGKPFSQCIAWSTDGKSFTKFAGNPVVPHVDGENRDPKVFWHAPSKKWVMALYLNNHHYALFGSPNLKEWTKLSDVDMPGTDECPDFFELPVDGKRSSRQWVFWGANGNYRLGDFDGKEFHPTTPIIASDHGGNTYAAQTYSNVKGRLIQVGWMRGADYSGCVWNQQMTFPNTLTLRSTPQGPRLAFWPVQESHALRKGKVASSGSAYDVASGLFELECHLRIPATGRLDLELNSLSVGFDPASGVLTCSGRSMKVETPNGVLSLRVLVDRTSVEIYAQDGLCYLPIFHIPAADAHRGLVNRSTGEWAGKFDVYELAAASSR